MANWDSFNSGISFSPSRKDPPKRSTLEKVLEFLDRPRDMIATPLKYIAKGEREKALPSVLRAAMGQEDTNYSEVLDEVLGKSKANKVLGFIADMALDPMNLIGVGELSKAGKAAEKIASAAKEGFELGSDVGKLEQALIKAGRDTQLGRTLGEQAEKGQRNLLRLRAQVPFSSKEIELGGIRAPKVIKAAENWADKVKGTGLAQDIAKLKRTKPLTTPLLPLMQESGISRADLLEGMQHSETPSDFTAFVTNEAKKTTDPETLKALSRNTFMGEMARRSTVQKAEQESVGRIARSNWQREISDMKREAMGVAKTLKLTPDELHNAILEHERKGATLSDTAAMEPVRKLVDKIHGVNKRLLDMDAATGAPTQELQSDALNYFHHAITNDARTAMRNTLGKVDPIRRVKDFDAQIKAQMGRNWRDMSIKDINDLARQGKLTVTASDGVTQLTLPALEKGFFREDPYEALLIRATQSADAQTAYGHIKKAVEQFGAKPVPVEVPLPRGQVVKQLRRNQDQVDRVVATELGQLASNMDAIGIVPFRKLLPGVSDDNIFKMLDHLSNPGSVTNVRKGQRGQDTAAMRLLRFAEDRLNARSKGGDALNNPVIKEFIPGKKVLQQRPLTEQEETYRKISDQVHGYVADELRNMRNQLAGSENGGIFAISRGLGNENKVLGMGAQRSTNPEWFRGQGMNKAKTLELLDKLADPGTVADIISGRQHPSKLSKPAQHLLDTALRNLTNGIDDRVAGVRVPPHEDYLRLQDIKGVIEKQFPELPATLQDKIYKPTQVVELPGLIQERNLKLNTQPWGTLQKNRERLLSNPTKTVMQAPDAGYVKAPGLKDANGKPIEMLKNVYMPEQVANELMQHWESMTGRDNVNRVVKAFDDIQGLWKRWNIFPHMAYTTRNAFGNVWNVVNHGEMDAAMAPKRFAQAAAIQLGKKPEGVIKTARGVDLTFGQVDDLAREHGVYGTGFLAGDVAKRADQLLGGGKKGGMQRLIDMNAGVEDNSRLALFVDRLAKGYNPGDAAEWVNKTLYDVGDMTDFERTKMKRLIPFYSWQAKNAEAMLAEGLMRPGKLTTADKLSKALSDDSIKRDEMTPWQSDQLSFAMKGKAVPISGLFPTVEGIRTIANPVQALLQGFTPLAKVPFEAVTKRDFEEGYSLLPKKPKAYTPNFDTDFDWGGGRDSNPYSALKTSLIGGGWAPPPRKFLGMQLSPLAEQTIKQLPVAGRFTTEVNHYMNADNKFEEIISYLTGLRRYDRPN